MKKILIAMLVTCLMAVGVQAATVTFTVGETSAGVWDVYADVTGSDTVGLAGYALLVDAASGTCGYTENALATLTGAGVIGMQNPTAQDVSGGYNIGNYQVNGSEIQSIGMSAVYVASLLPTVYPDVNLAAHALLGTVTTPTSVVFADWSLDGVGATAFSLNLGDTDPNNDIVPDTSVILLPEPATLMVLLGGVVVGLIGRRR